MLRFPPPPFPQIAERGPLEALFGPALLDPETDAPRPVAGKGHEDDPDAEAGCALHVIVSRSSRVQLEGARLKGG